MNFPTDLKAIQTRVDAINPEEYGRTRNFKDGAVTYLSPYISRGVVSTKMVFDHILKLNLPWPKVEKLLQELAWRDYWQQVWISKGNLIDEDLKQTQSDVAHYQIPRAIINAQTGISIIDEGILKLKDEGYMHNHMRMYIASISCNVGQSHWSAPAKWMYSLLLDGDWASNALSWQWVAGTNANKKYYVNQENINKYFYSDQKDTFLDKPYEAIPSLPIPELLKLTGNLQVKTVLPKTLIPDIKPEQKTLIYNYYNLDPYWYQDENCNRILLLEPDFFNKYPVHKHCIDFILSLAKNIAGLQIFSGNFEQLQSISGASEIRYKEHPTNQHYQGIEEARDWMFDVKGYYPSFFAFWKKCKKQIQQSISI